jgi:hypothetical protein
MGEEGGDKRDWEIKVVNSGGDSGRCVVRDWMGT